MRPGWCFLRVAVHARRSSAWSALNADMFKRRGRLEFDSTGGGDALHGEGVAWQGFEAFANAHRLGKRFAVGCAGELHAAEIAAGDFGRFVRYAAAIDKAADLQVRTLAHAIAFRDGEARGLGRPENCRGRLSVPSLPNGAWSRLFRGHNRHKLADRQRERPKPRPTDAAGTPNGTADGSEAMQSRTRPRGPLFVATRGAMSTTSRAVENGTL